jgi:hypothetical protein
MLTYTGLRLRECQALVVGDISVRDAGGSKLYMIDVQKGKCLSVNNVALPRNIAKANDGGSEHV